MENYEELYDKIQEVTTQTMNYCGNILMESVKGKRTQFLLHELQKSAGAFSDIAHELEEHLAFDNLNEQQNEEDMTITLNFHIYEGVDGKTYFVEKYIEKGNKVALWRYGYKGYGDLWEVISGGLRSKPNLKKLNLIK